jgi:hypothetical protein
MWQAARDWYSMRRPIHKAGMGLFTALAVVRVVLFLVSLGPAHGNLVATGPPPAPPSCPLLQEAEVTAATHQDVESVSNSPAPGAPPYAVGLPTPASCTWFLSAGGFVVLQDFGHVDRSLLPSDTPGAPVLDIGSRSKVIPVGAGAPDILSFAEDDHLFILYVDIAASTEAGATPDVAVSLEAAKSLARIVVRRAT